MKLDPEPKLGFYTPGVVHNPMLMSYRRGSSEGDIKSGFPDRSGAFALARSDEANDFGG